MYYEIFPDDVSYEAAMKKVILGDKNTKYPKEWFTNSLDKIVKAVRVRAKLK